MVRTTSMFRMIPVRLEPLRTQFVQWLFETGTNSDRCDLKPAPIEISCFDFMRPVQTEKYHAYRSYSN